MPPHVYPLGTTPHAAALPVRSQRSLFVTLNLFSAQRATLTYDQLGYRQWCMSVDLAQSLIGVQPWEGKAWGLRLW